MVDNSGKVIKAISVWGKKGSLLNPKKSAFCTKKGVIFGQIVSEKGVFFRLGNADTSYLVHMSAGTGV